MAKIAVGKTLNPVSIDKFLGLNISNTGDTQIKLGESGNMDNFFITNDLKLRKMYGYKCIHTFEEEIKGIYSTKLNSHEYLFIASGGRLYYFLDDEIDDDSTWETLEPHDVGAIGEEDTSFFTFDGKVYILSGQYQCFDGTLLTTVEGYTPLIAINTPAGPNGGGIIYDELNMINGRRHQQFNGDSSENTYKLLEDNIFAVSRVIMDGVDLSSGDYSVNTQTGTVTITSPTTGTNNIDIYYDKPDSSSLSIINGMKFGTIFGGDVDTRVFLYGNPECQNRIYYSGIADGEPSVEYFPSSCFVDVGPSNFAVTDLTRHYDRLLVTTNKTEAYYITIGTENLTITIPGSNEQTTKLVPSVSTYPLNEAHGNVAMGQGRLINNNPVTIDDNAIIEWQGTNVRDERNMAVISEPIRLDLIDLSLNLLKTVDNEPDNQLWLGENNRIYIFNYYNRTYSRLKITDSLREFTLHNRHVIMSCEGGKIMKWDQNYSTYNGETINAHWEMNFYDFGADYLRKTMRRLWVLMQPQMRSSAVVSYVTNRGTNQNSQYISYNIQVMDNVDFSDFTFNIETNPQPFRLKMKAKKWTNMKITIDNNEDTRCTILGLTLRVESFGESK